MYKNCLSILSLSLMLLCSFHSRGAEPMFLENNASVQSLNSVYASTQQVGLWDEAYVSAYGYFLYSEDIAAISSLGSSSFLGESSTLGFDILAFMSADCKTTAIIAIDKRTRLPLKIIVNDAKVTFDLCFLSDNVLEIVAETPTDMTLIKSTTCDVTSLRQSASAYDTDLMRTLFMVVNIVGDNLSSVEQVQSAINLFRQTLKHSVEPLSSMTNKPLKDSRNSDYRFVVVATNKITEMTIDLAQNIVLWTGDATFKLGGSSVSLDGVIYCAATQWRQLGTYGILVDKNPANLTIEAADFKMQANQADEANSFEVDFRGFEQSTTYYYRAYYAFTTDDHGGLQFKYGEPNAQVGYDPTIKSFTTTTNILNVDVVMCIDVTGSMSDVISMVKSNALTFYNQFKNRCDANNIELRSLNTQVIQFRDINEDGFSALLTSPVYSLPGQQSQFSSYVNSMSASGGGDTPESGLEALHAAFTKSDWGQDDGFHRQIVILWTDAPFQLGGGYSRYTLGQIQSLWDAMPSGRRMILFAPNGTTGTHSGNWSSFDSWSNVVHITDITRGFNNMGSVLDDVIGELTGREHIKQTTTEEDLQQVVTNFREN